MTEGEQDNIEEIHGFNIKVDDSHSKTLKDLTHNWKHEMTREELNDVLRTARHAPGGKVHLDDNTTLVHKDGDYVIKRRS